MSDSDTNVSDVSNLSDIANFDLSAEFDDTIQQITSIQTSYDLSLQKLIWIQDHIHSIHPFATILAELHAESLKEIEETGQSSFGSKIITRLSL